MSGLESCERIKMDVLRLHFDTIKRDKKERVYKVEEGLGQVQIVISFKFKYCKQNNNYIFPYLCALYY